MEQLQHILALAGIKTNFPEAAPRLYSWNKVQNKESFPVSTHRSTHRVCVCVCRQAVSLSVDWLKHKTIIWSWSAVVLFSPPPPRLHHLLLVFNWTAAALSRYPGNEPLSALCVMAVRASSSFVNNQICRDESDSDELFCDWRWFMLHTTFSQGEAAAALCSDIKPQVQLEFSPLTFI